MNGDALLKESITFNKHLLEIKNKIPNDFPWYPYGSLNNFIHLQKMFNKRPIDSLVGKSRSILDIGAADGDLSFFLEHLGYKVDMVDNGPTNMNLLKGAKLLKEELNSNAGIHEIDLDSQFEVPSKQYNLVFFLGILYHLKNPYYILETLSNSAKYLILSTRIAKFTPDNTLIQNSSLAYLLAPDESNGDSTNYWIFSDTGLRRLLERSGWDILEMTTVGDKTNSNPCDQDHDERAFAILKSKNLTS